MKIIHSGMMIPEVLVVKEMIGYICSVLKMEKYTRIQQHVIFESEEAFFLGIKLFIDAMHSDIPSN